MGKIVVEPITIIFEINLGMSIDIALSLKFVSPGHINAYKGCGKPNFIVVKIIQINIDDKQVKKGI